MSFDNFITLSVIMAIGLIFIFWKGVEDIDFFYMFDGKWKESHKWRKFKRKVIGIILVVTSLANLYKQLKASFLIVKLAKSVIMMLISLGNMHLKNDNEADNFYYNCGHHYILDN